MIVLLGIDGAGKTTTAAALTTAVRNTGQPAIMLRNRSCRRWLIHTSRRFGKELPVRWSDRVETVVRTVNVLLAHGEVLVSLDSRSQLTVMDRHLVCQLVLRNVRGLPPGWLLPWLSDRLLRTVTVAVLDVPAETAHERIRIRGEDHETLEYLRAARSAYLDIARSRSWRVVDATETTDVILTQLLNTAAR
ncbi:thymidylate kinase [Citricoccus nitrophenolicus]|uniref:thymidylate kinase n=1 Tax=Citricoccus nitrophenolicus TaxID=863575 RepID=UPI0031EC2C30